MSLDGGSGVSPYDSMKANRHRVNDMTLGFNTSTSPLARCPTCVEQWKLEVSTTAEGKKIGKCIRGCGGEYPLEPNKDPESQSKYTTRFGTANNQKYSSFIISQPRKKSKYDLADEEAKEAVRKETNAKAITIKDTSEMIYSENGAPT